MDYKDRAVSLLTPPSCTAGYKVLSETAIHDLGLDYLCGKVTEKKQEQTLLLSVLSKMTDNPEVTRYRSDVFEDIYRNEAMRDEMLRILDKINFLRDYGSVGRIYEESAGIWDLVKYLLLMETRPIPSASNRSFKLIPSVTLFSSVVVARKASISFFSSAKPLSWYNCSMYSFRRSSPSERTAASERLLNMASTH